MTHEERAWQLVHGFFIGGGGDGLQQPNLTKHDLAMVIKGAMEEATKDTTLQNDELKNALSQFTDGNSGHDEDNGRCVYHTIIGVPHVWPCPVREAQRLVSGKPKCENLPPASKLKMALELVLDAWSDSRDCSAAPGHPEMALAVQIARALLYGPEIDPRITEKRICGLCKGPLHEGTHHCDLA